MFCGASPGGGPIFRQAVRELGLAIARRGLVLVYGGGHVGLMGSLAAAALEAGGKVVGVIPRSLADRELAHHGLTRLHVVDGMHERKARMAELAHGFVAAPGGFGTIEELFEVLTWGQLGFHDKPCALLNTAGYYDGLLSFLDHATDNQFVLREHRDMIVVDQDPHTLLDRLVAYRPPTVDKAAWARRMTCGGDPAAHATGGDR